MAEANENQDRGLRRTRQGIVVSDKRDKTRTVAVERQRRHPKYGKIVGFTTRYQVDDPNNESQTGDRVEITHCRPISKTKSWRLVRVIEKSAELQV